MFINTIFSKTLNLINNLFYQYFYNWYYNYNYKNILEYVPKTNIKIKNQNLLNSEFIENINNICNKLNNKKLIISLSGGVDSMVLTTILHYLEYELICVHINYNNRIETREEEKFLIQWCKFNNIKLYIKSINEIKRENTKRRDYELLTKNIRFDFYREIMQKENIDHVLLAHHKDDIIENIFANFCRGRNYLDLAVIREQSIINKIEFVRPMIAYYKKTVYDFAHVYQVPYFKDTTPDWSVRGKYRNIITPAINDAFTSNVKENLLNISKQADDWNILIEKEIINPFIEEVKFNFNDTNVSIQFNVEKYIDYPIAFWSVVFMNLFNQFGHKCPSKKGIQTFINTIKYRGKQNDSHKYNVTLCNSTKCTIKNFNVSIQFKVD